MSPFQPLGWKSLDSSAGCQQATQEVAPAAVATPEDNDDGDDDDGVGGGGDDEDDDRDDDDDDVEGIITQL